MVAPMIARSLLAAAVLAACSHAAPPPPVAPPSPSPAPAAPPIAAVSAKPAAAPAAAQPDADPFLWLENVDAPRSMAWVKDQNTRTLAALEKTPGFDQLRAQIREVLDDKDKIPYVSRRGTYLYNFWTDADHPRGLWRRTTLADYKKPHPTWQVLLDIDALGKAEHQSWVWEGATCKEPQWKRCLVSLSRGGADAVVVREFDLSTKKFVDGGFTLPEAKSEVAWKDADDIYVATDFGPGSMSSSGYPRIVKLWKRGTPLAQATEVYEAKPSDMSAGASHDFTAGFERDFVSRQIDFWNSETYLRAKDGTLTKIDVPLDAIPDLHREWMTIQLRSPWTVGATTYPAGALLATRFDDFMKGKRDLVVLFQPDDHTSLSSTSWTRHELILDEMHDVVSKVEVLTPAAHGAWKRAALGDAPALSTVEAGGADEEHTDEYFMTSSGFLSPTTLSRGVLGAPVNGAQVGRAQVLKRAPSFFVPSGLDVHQDFATSKDGTRIPYFVVAPKQLAPTGDHPTLLYGYGGFEDALQPFYSGVVGRAWLARGGVYVIANIRGGGEYGPKWHEAALKANRLRAYEDFAAVAQDLIAKKVTSPAHLAAQGGSNGGLLVGNMLTLYPQLFGAIACEVPLLDMKRYTHIAAGASWIAEYGDPDDPAQWSFIQKFSPYQNVHTGEKYPPVLFTTTTRDDRVGPQHARKMAAKMEGMGDDVLFFENTEGGHGYGADSEQESLMTALEYAFLWNHVAAK